MEFLSANVHNLSTLLEGARLPVAMDQVELHPYLQQPRLLEVTREAGVAVTAYSPLGSPDRPPRLKRADEPNLLGDATIARIAERHGASPAQVLIAWAVARGTAVIPKSVDAGRLRENLAAGELELDPEDLRDIAALDRGRRYVDGTFWEREGGPYRVEDLWRD